MTIQEKQQEIIEEFQVSGRLGAEIRIHYRLKRTERFA